MSNHNSKGLDTGSRTEDNHRMADSRRTQGDSRTGDDAGCCQARATAGGSSP